MWQFYLSCPSTAFFQCSISSFYKHCIFCYRDFFSYLMTSAFYPKVLPSTLWNTGGRGSWQRCKIVFRFHHRMDQFLRSLRTFCTFRCSRVWTPQARCSCDPEYTSANFSITPRCTCPWSTYSGTQCSRICPSSWMVQFSSYRRNT